jgi:hypothetical protein
LEGREAVVWTLLAGLFVLCYLDFFRLVSALFSFFVVCVALGFIWLIMFAAPSLVAISAGF